MSWRRRIAIVGLLTTLTASTEAQSPSDGNDPRTPWGEPDLQSIWLYWTATPLERPEEFADREVVTAEEAAAFVSRQQDGVGGETSGDWNPLTGLLDGRTSLLTNPTNGRLQERSEAGQHRADTMGRPDVFVSADGFAPRVESVEVVDGWLVGTHAALLNQVDLVHYGAFIDRIEHAAIGERRPKATLQALGRCRDLNPNEAVSLTQ